MYFTESSFPTLQYFFSFFHLVCKLSKGLFQPLCQSLNCMSWVFESCNKHISDMFRSLSINFYLRPCSIAIYGKFYLYCLYHFRLISGLLIVWFIKYALSFESAKIHKHCLHWSVFSADINRKIIFNCFPLFKLFLLVSKLYESSH